MGYSERYYPVKVYFFIMKMAFDIEDLEHRTASIVSKRNESLFSTDVATSICLREFLRKRNVTLVSLYKELVTNKDFNHLLGRYEILLQELIADEDDILEYWLPDIKKLYLAGPMTDYKILRDMIKWKIHLVEKRN